MIPLEKIIVAFEGEKTAQKFSDIIQSELAGCIICHSPDEVRRLVARRELGVVVCGYKLRDVSAAELAEDLPPSTVVLVVAKQSRLELCESERLFCLPAPVSRGDLLASVRLALQMSQRLERLTRPRRGENDRQIVEQAKALLMDRHGMSEAQAHRFIQKRSMDSGSKMVQTARLILDELT